VKDEPGGRYVRKVHDETLRYSQELLAENERMRVRVADLEATVAGLEAQQRELHRRLQAVQADTQRFADTYGAIERQNTELANLYVASYRLHGTLDRTEVMLAIQEILANLVGCEEAAVFELDEAAGVLRLAGSFGMDASGLAEVPLGTGIIGGSVASGQQYITSQTEPAAAPGPGEATLTACIPITLEGRVTGAIALFRLLGHKGGLAEVDRELFELLANQAGMALYCTRLHAERRSAAESNPAR